MEKVKIYGEEEELNRVKEDGRKQYRTIDRSERERERERERVSLEGGSSGRRLFLFSR